MDENGWEDRSGRMPSGLSGLDRASLDEAAVAALAGEGAVPDHCGAPHEYRANGAADLEALVRGVVARVVEVGGAEGAAGCGVEQDDVGITAGLDGALPGQAEEPCGCGREEIDQSLRRDSVAADALRPGDRQQCLD